MKMRSILTLITVVAFLLFFIFSLVEVKNSILLFLFFVILIASVKFFEVVYFFSIKKKLLRLGEVELFNDQLRSILISVLAVLFLYVVIKVPNYYEIKLTSFVGFFIGEHSYSKYLFAFLFINVIRTFLDNNRVFYLTNKGLLCPANYFEDYIWQEFKGYKIIEEQSLIRFTKKNDKFLFVKYEESYFEKRNIGITEVLNKNLKRNV